MKKKITFLACAMLMCVSLANADNGQKVRTIDHFPGRAPVVRENGPARNVPLGGLNDDKDWGTKMWASTVTDYNRDPGFVYFYSNRPRYLTKTGIIMSREQDELRRWTMSSGTYHNGKYLAFFYYRYDFNINHPRAFASVDLEHGTWTQLADLSALEDHWDFIESMSTDPATGKLMAMARKRDGTVASTFGEINAQTGAYTKLADLDQYYFAIAYDAYGTLWAARWNSSDGNTVDGSRLVTLNPNNGYKEDKVIKLKRDGYDFKMYFQNTMYFEPGTGDLYIAAANTEGYQHLYKLNTETGVMDEKGPMGYGDIVTGMYIPGTVPASLDAASRVTELSSTFDDNGVVTLKWKNPTTSWKKEPLTELAEVLVYRDGTEDDKLVATLKNNVEVGGEMTWTDNTATQGVHVYYIVPCRVSGEKGVENTWRAFSGRDVPGYAENVTLTKNSNKSLTLAWEQPSVGKNDGWFDKANVKYDVKRMPDKKVVATGISTTTLTDNDLGGMNSYYYTIRAYTADGGDLEAESPSVMAGNAYDTPYHTTFDTMEEGSQWTSVDANGDGTKFEYRDNMEPKGFHISTSTYGNDEYVVSPAVNLKGGKTYKVKLRVYFQYCTTERTPDRAQTFSITVGKGATAEAQNVELKQWKDFKHFNWNETLEFEVFYKPESDGEYNFAYHYYDKDYENKPYDDITVSGAWIEEVFDNDLAAMAIEGNAIAVKGTENEYAVKVKNKGARAASSYKVQAVRVDGGNRVMLGETEVNEPLASQADTLIKVNVTPDVEGDFLLAGVVVLPGDEDVSNDTTESISVFAEPEGTKPFNRDINGDFEGVNTRIPISFTDMYSHSQSIYNTDEMKDVSKIYRLAFEYDGNPSSATPLENIDFNVMLYLGMTDDAVYSKENPQWKPLPEQTKVFEGSMKVMQGQGNMLVFNLEKPFEFDDTKNLVVTVLKNGNVNDEWFPVSFKVFNDDWNAATNRSMLFDNNNFQVAEQGDGYGWACLPVLHLAVEKSGVSTGIEDIIVGGSGISYCGGAINFGGIDAVSVTVYDLMGRTVASKYVPAGMTATDAKLVQGAYVIKVTDRNGKIYTAKVCVGK